MKKHLIILFTLILTVFSISAVEWPLAEQSEESIVSYFAQNTGGKISTSLLFKEPTEVQAVKDGRILIIMSDIEDDSEFFPSALGTSVIIAHNDDLISVYSNLDRDSVKEKTEGKKQLLEGEVFGQTGNSGWQKDQSSLEFQIMDIQNSAAINPKILLPRSEKEIDYRFGNVYLKNKEGKLYDLKENKVFPSGSYRVYHTRNAIAIPYKITATINGVIVDEIAFDTISSQNGKLYVNGKKQYSALDLYPDESLLFSGDLMLTPGKSTLAITIENYLGKTKQTSYILSIY